MHTDFRAFWYLAKIEIHSRLFFIHYTAARCRKACLRLLIVLIIYLFFVQFSCEAAQGVLARLDSAHAAAVLELRLQRLRTGPVADAEDGCCHRPRPQSACTRASCSPHQLAVVLSQPATLY
jgi:hypothetical protein